MWDPILKEEIGLSPSNPHTKYCIHMQHPQWCLPFIIHNVPYSPPPPPPIHAKVLSSCPSNKIGSPSFTLSSIPSITPWTHLQTNTSLACAANVEEATQSPSYQPCDTSCDAFSLPCSPNRPTRHPPSMLMPHTGSYSNHRA